MSRSFNLETNSRRKWHTFTRRPHHFDFDVGETATDCYWSAWVCPDTEPKLTNPFIIVRFIIVYLKNKIKKISQQKTLKFWIFRKWTLWRTIVGTIHRDFFWDNLSKNLGHLPKNLGTFVPKFWDICRKILGHSVGQNFWGEKNAFNVKKIIFFAKKSLDRWSSNFDFNEWDCFD